MATVHRYPVSVAWQGGRGGQGTIRTPRTHQAFNIAAPPEFGGTGTAPATNPEELLASAVAGCYAITFGVVAAHKRLPVVRLDLEGVGEVDEDGPRFTYRAITLRPRVVVRADATDEQVEQTLVLARKADNYCLVTNAVPVVGVDFGRTGGRPRGAGSGLRAAPITCPWRVGAAPRAARPPMPAYARCSSRSRWKWCVPVSRVTE